MRLRLPGIALCAVGLALAVASATTATIDGTPAATPSVFPPGITFERLAQTPPGPHGLPGPEGPGTMIEVLARITYAPGATFAFHAPGPILYYVEQGPLTVQLNQGHTALFIPGNPSGYTSTTFHRNEPIMVPAGQGIYADDGYAGTTRNAGQQPVIVLVTYHYTMSQNGVHHHLTATVAPQLSTPTS